MDTSSVFPIDVDHQGIRLAVPALIVTGFIAGYALISLLLIVSHSDVSVGCVPLVGGIICALVVSAVGDRVLKRVWPSGRTLTLDQAGLELRDNRKRKQATFRVEWAHRINVLSWRFSVKRGSARIPKGWIMLGLQLLQDDVLVTLYTFAPEKVASTLPGFQAFVQIAPQAMLESNDLPLREKLEQRRLHKAENERWEDGAELRHQDFQKLMETLTQRVSDWQSRA
jgi:hypothetical protein